MYYSQELVLATPDTSCIDGDSTNLFIGTSNGELLHYVAHEDTESLSIEHSYLLASKQEMSGKSVPKDIVILHEVQLVAVLVSDTLSFYTLPEFAPASDLRSVKDVQGVIRVSYAMASNESEAAFLTVFTRKKIREIKITRISIKLIREVEYADCLIAAQQGSIVCVATTASYDLVDLERRARIQLFPVVQGESDPIGEKYVKYRPYIISVLNGEFLVVSGSPEASSSMGMFINQDGDITRGTLMFEGYPLAVQLDATNIIALLDVNTIEIHDIATQQKLLSFATTAVRMIQSPSLLLVVVAEHFRCIVRHHLGRPPRKDESLAARRISNTFSGIRLINPSKIDALVSETALSVMDQLLDKGDCQAALTMMESVAKDAASVYTERVFHEQAYVRQKAGFVYFAQMLFDDAMDCFVLGDTDPRIILQLYPEFSVDIGESLVYGGLHRVLHNVKDVDKVILENLAQNVDDEATLQELHSILRTNAIELLRRFLTKFREKRDLASQMIYDSAEALDSLVNRTLLRILLEMDRGESKDKLRDFFNIQNSCTTEILELLRQSERWILTIRVLAAHGKADATLDIWAKLYDGQYKDLDYIGDALLHIKSILDTTENNELIRSYGLWLLQRDLATGISMLVDAMQTERLQATPAQVLEENRQHKDLYRPLLKDFVLQNRLRDTQYIDEYISMVALETIDSLRTPEVRNTMTEVIEQYRNLSPPKITFLSFTNVSSKSEQTVAFFSRMEELLSLLQSSLPYSPFTILNLVLQEKDLLLAPRIILYGRMSKHSESLNLLVHDLRDFDGAESYCYHGGISLGQIILTKEKIEVIKLRHQLFPRLLQECLQLHDNVLQFQKAIQILNRWGNYIDLDSVITMLPSFWSLNLIHIFLHTGLGRLSSKKREAMIKRSLYRWQSKRIRSRVSVRIEASR